MALVPGSGGSTRERHGGIKRVGRIRECLKARIKAASLISSAITLADLHTVVAPSALDAEARSAQNQF